MNMESGDSEKARRVPEQEITSRIFVGEPSDWVAEFDKLTRHIRGNDTVRLYDTVRREGGEPTFSDAYNAMRKVLQAYEDGAIEIDEAKAAAEPHMAVLDDYRDALNEVVEGEQEEPLTEKTTLEEAAREVESSSTEKIIKPRRSFDDVKEEREAVKREQKRRKARAAVVTDPEAEGEEGIPVVEEPADVSAASAQEAPLEETTYEHEALEWKAHLETIAQVAERLAEMDETESQLAPELRSIADGINPEAFDGRDEDHFSSRLNRLRTNMRRHLNFFIGELMRRYVSNAKEIQTTGDALLECIHDPQSTDQAIVEAMDRFKNAVEEAKNEQESAANLPAVHENYDAAKEEWKEYAAILAEYASIAGVKDRGFKSELAAFSETARNADVADAGVFHVLENRVGSIHAHLLAALAARAEQFAKGDAEKRARSTETLRRIEMLFNARRTDAAPTFEELRDALHDFEESTTTERGRQLQALEKVTSEIEPLITDLQGLLRTLQTVNPEAYDALRERIMDVHGIADDEENIPDPFIWAELLEEGGATTRLNMAAVAKSADGMVTKILDNAVISKEILEGLLKEYTPMAGTVVRGEAEEIREQQQNATVGSGSYDREAASDWTPEQEQQDNENSYIRNEEMQAEGAGRKTSRVEGTKARAFAETIANATTLDEYREALYSLDANGIRSKNVPPFTPSSVIYSINQLQSLIQNDRDRFEHHRNDLAALTEEMAKDNGPLSFVPEKWGMRNKLAELIAKEHGLLESAPSAEGEPVQKADTPTDASPEAPTSAASTPEAAKVEAVIAEAIPDPLKKEEAKAADEKLAEAGVVPPHSSESPAGASAIPEAKTAGQKVKESYAEKLRVVQEGLDKAREARDAYAKEHANPGMVRKFLGLGPSKKTQRELAALQERFDTIQDGLITLLDNRRKEYFAAGGKGKLKGHIPPGKGRENEHILYDVEEKAEKRHRARMYGNAEVISDLEKIEKRTKGRVYMGVLAEEQHRREVQYGALAKEMPVGKREVMEKLTAGQAFKKYVAAVGKGALIGMAARTAVGGVLYATGIGAPLAWAGLMGGAVGGAAGRTAAQAAEDLYFRGRAQEKMRSLDEEARERFLSDPANIKEAQAYFNEATEGYRKHKRNAMWGKRAAAAVGGAGVGSAAGSYFNPVEAPAPTPTPPEISADELAKLTLHAPDPSAEPLNIPVMNEPLVETTVIEDATQIEHPAEGFKWTVKEGDTVWDLMRKEFEARYPDMSRAQIRELTDYFEDRVNGDDVSTPEDEIARQEELKEMGFHLNPQGKYDPDNIYVGDELDLSSFVTEEDIAEQAKRVLEGHSDVDASSAGSSSIDGEVSSATIEPQPVETTTVESDLTEAGADPELEKVVLNEMRADLQNHSVRLDQWNGASIEGHPLKEVNAGEFGQRLSRPFGFAIKADLEPIGQREDLPLDKVFNSRNTGVLSKVYKMLEERAEASGINLDQFLASKANYNTTLEEAHAELVRAGMQKGAEAAVPVPGTLPEFTNEIDSVDWEHWENLTYPRASLGAWIHDGVGKAAADVEELTDAQDASGWARHYLDHFIPRIRNSDLSKENIPAIREELQALRSMLDYVENKFDGIPKYTRYSEDLKSLEKLLNKNAGSRVNLTFRKL